MFVSAVQPVMILSAVFCVVRILFKLVSEMIGILVFLHYFSLECAELATWSLRGP